MSGRRRSTDLDDVLGRAIDVEGLHYWSLFEPLYAGHPDEDVVAQCAASLFAAAAGAAQRVVCEHPSCVTGERTRLAACAATIVEELPPELHLLWRLHYVDAHPLSVYVMATGLSEGAALDHYREIVRALVDATHKAGTHSERAIGPRDLGGAEA
jgi:hypothetical protein